MTWTAPAFTAALTTQVAARPVVASLANPTVRVVDYLPSPEENLTDTVIIGYEAEDDAEAIALGDNRHDETVIVRCLIITVRPGAGEAVARQCKDRAALLLGEVDDELRTNAPEVGNQTLRARVSRRSFTDDFATSADRGGPVRRYVVGFEITYRART